MQQGGVRVAFYAQEKMGKTTLGAQAPKPLFVPLEVGFVGVKPIIEQRGGSIMPQIQKWEDFDGLITEIAQACNAKQFPFKSIVIDSATAVERLINDFVIRSDVKYKPGNPENVTMESAMGSYGKAYVYARDKFQDLLNKFDYLANNFNINIVFTAHAFAAKNIDPTVGEYDQWEVLLHSPKNQKTYGNRELFKQWLDAVCFIYEPFCINAQEGVSVGISLNKGRVLGFSQTPNYIAGNRFGLNCEIDLPLVDGWQHFAKTIFDSSQINLSNQ